jgi:hypothetical protein
VSLPNDKTDGKPSLSTVKEGPPVVYNPATARSIELQAFFASMSDNGDAEKVSLTHPNFFSRPQCYSKDVIFSASPTIQWQAQEVAANQPATTE